MIALLHLSLLAALGATLPAEQGPQGGDAGPPGDSLVAWARARPLGVRDSLAWALRRVARDSASAQDSALARAHALAGAYAMAWQDSFLVRRVALFEAWTPAQRSAWYGADSLRRVGVEAYGADGPTAARRLWRRSLARARAIPDSALIGGLSGNIGAAYLADGALDSATAWLAWADEVAGAIGDYRVQANAVGALGAVAEDQGDLAGARRRYTEATRIRERIGDTRGIAADQNNLGLLALGMGDLEEAGRYFESALGLNRRDGQETVAATNLVNLAGIAATRGDFAVAELRYREALAIWQRDGMDSEAAAALHGLGQLEIRRGDYREARLLLQQALASYLRTGPAAQEVAVRRDLAGALAAMGQLQSARDELARAQSAAERSPSAPSVRARVTLAQADLATMLNSHEEARQLYAEAARLYREAGDAAGGAEADQGLGRLLLERGDTSAARQHLQTALRAARASGDRRAAGITLLSLGAVSRQAGDTAAARRSYAEALAIFREIGDAVAEAAARGELAGLELEGGAAAVSAAGYRQALGQLQGRRAPDVSWQLRAGLADALLALAQPGEAVRELRLAMLDVEQAGSGFRAEARRAQYMADKWAVYARLALVEAERGMAGAAFEASEQLRAREMLAVLTQGQVAGPAPTADLVLREQDLRRQVSELAAVVEQRVALTSPVRGPGGTSADAGALEALSRAQAAYQELLVEMRERAPARAALVAPRVADWRAVGARLAPGEAMIEYLVDDTRAMAFVIRHDTIVTRTLGTNRRSLSRLVEFARGTLDPPGRDRPDTLWRGPLRQLYQLLVGRLEEDGLLEGITRLVLVPHGELHYLPFPALIEAGPRGRFLVQRYEIATTPSASVWLALGARAPARSQGVLALAPEVAVLPASRREAERAAGFGGSPGVALLGEAATEARFRGEAPKARVIHLATNGVLNQHNPLFSNVVLAPGEGDDGRLEVHEIFGLELDADLVVLSACQTGLGSGAAADLPPGDDWVGLTRAFLSAGAGEVIATLWAVDDWATAELMDRFYAAYGRQPDATSALAEAQRDLLARRGLAHPYYWAGFTVVGGANTAAGGSGR